MHIAGGAVPHGTGCIFTDPMQIANAAGEKGLKCFCHMLEGLPVHSFIQLPSRVPAAEGMETSGGYFSPEDTLRLMEEIGKIQPVSLGEVNAGELDGESTLKKLSYAASRGIRINGHCPSMGHDDLSVAAAAGISSDHEAESGEELSHRLSTGMSVMVRQGTIEPNCEALIKYVVENDLPTDSLMFCTDDKSPEDILENGCIDNNIRIAIGCGLDPIKAIKLATLNPARHFGADDKLGSCTPGRYADFVLFEDLNSLAVKKVYFKGKLAAENGIMWDFPQKSAERELSHMLDTVKISDNLSEASLAVSLPHNCRSFTAAVINMKSDSLITYKTQRTLKAESGFPIADTENDILPIAVIEHYGKGGGVGCGFIHGLGIKHGAVASSTAQEGNNIAVSGTSYSDMLTAVKAVANAGGGSAVCIGGKVIALRRLPFCGIMGTGSITDEIAAADSFSKALDTLGSSNPRLMSVLTVSLCPSIPEIGLTDKGLIDVCSHKFISAADNCLF